MSSRCALIEGDGLPPRRILDFVGWVIGFGGIHGETKPAVVLGISVDKYHAHTHVGQPPYPVLDEV